MFTYKDADDTIKGHFCCDIAKVGASNMMDCEHCPYKDLDDVVTSCVDRLNNDIQYYLKEVKKAAEKQPELPGISEKKEVKDERRNDRSNPQVSEFYDRKRSKR